MTQSPVSAKNTLRQRRSTANWSRLFISPIRLDDGTLLFTLKDAAERILKLPAAPSSRVAAQRLIDAALRNGDMSSARAAVRLALHRLPRSKAIDATRIDPTQNDKSGSHSMPAVADALTFGD
jgi:hypothetical protein